MYILTLEGREDQGAYSVTNEEGRQVLYLFEEEDDCDRFAMMLEEKEEEIPVLNVLKENKSNLAFISTTNITVDKISPGLEITNGFKKEKAGNLINRGSPPKNRAIDGVGRPTK